MDMKREKSGSKHGTCYVVARTWGHTSDTGNMNCQAATQTACQAHRTLHTTKTTKYL